VDCRRFDAIDVGSAPGLEQADADESNLAAF
jgi:hypothetical protein